MVYQVTPDVIHSDIPDKAGNKNGLTGNNRLSVSAEDLTSHGCGAGALALEAVRQQRHVG